jgi:hypothetical protein
MEERFALAKGKCAMEICSAGAHILSFCVLPVEGLKACTYPFTVVLDCFLAGLIFCPTRVAPFHVQHAVRCLVLVHILRYLRGSR